MKEMKIYHTDHMKGDNTHTIEISDEIKLELSDERFIELCGLFYLDIAKREENIIKRQKT